MISFTRSSLTFVVASALAACGGTFVEVGNPDQCSESFDDCPGQSICIFGLCEPAFPRIFSISVDEVRLMSTDKGACWDLPCGPPDPYVVIRVDGREVGETSERSDTFDASWSDVFQAPLDQGSDIEIIVRDTDIDRDDEVITCSAQPIDADLLRARALSCGDIGISNYVRVTIDPR